MAKITFTRQAILGGRLDEERHALLSMVARLDIDDHYQDDKYVRPLLKKRLQEIEEERKLSELAQSDAGEYADVVGEIGEENLRLNSQTDL